MFLQSPFTFLNQTLLAPQGGQAPVGRGFVGFLVAYSQHRDKCPAQRALAARVLLGPPPAHPRLSSHRRACVARPARRTAGKSHGPPLVRV